MNGVEVRCFGARSAPERTGTPGEVLECGHEGLVVACGEGAVRIAEVHPAGQKRLAAAQWMRGRGVRIGDFFE